MKHKKVFTFSNNSFSYYLNKSSSDGQLTIQYDDVIVNCYLIEEKNQKLTLRG